MPCIGESGVCLYPIIIFLIQASRLSVFPEMLSNNLFAVTLFNFCRYDKGSDPATHTLIHLDIRNQIFLHKQSYIINY